MADQTRSHLVTLSWSSGSITLPAEVRHRHHLDEPGAQVRVVERDDGVIELHPLPTHRVDQTWFWAKRWQQMEQEAEDDITAGRVETFDRADAFVADLELEARERGPTCNSSRPSGSPATAAGSPTRNSVEGSTALGRESRATAEPPDRRYGSSNSPTVAWRASLA